jgi:hypothetical protein
MYLSEHQSDTSFFIFLPPLLSYCWHWTFSRPMTLPSSEMHSHFSHGYGSVDLVSREAGMLFTLSKCQVHLLIFPTKPNSIRDLEYDYNNWSPKGGVMGRTDFSEFLAELNCLHFFSLVPLHYSFCWVPVLLAVMRVPLVSLRLCLLHQVCILSHPLQMQRQVVNTLKIVCKLAAIWAYIYVLEGLSSGFHYILKAV